MGDALGLMWRAGNIDDWEGIIVGERWGRKSKGESEWWDSERQNQADARDGAGKGRVEDLRTEWNGC